MAAAMSHGSMPFMKLAEELKLPRLEAYQPLFQAAITSADAGEAHGLPMHFLCIAPVGVCDAARSFPLPSFVNSHQGQPQQMQEYKKELFQPVEAPLSIAANWVALHLHPCELGGFG